jgi:hypothetical protein
MRIEQLGMVLRPRISWEALDLGFLLVWHTLWPLYRLWLALFIPFATLLYVVCSLFEMPWLAPLFLWWLKPVFDRILLHFFSHALFGEYPSIGATVRHIHTLLKSRVLLALTLGRFDFARSFRLPVWQLEGLSTTAGRKRVHLLEKGARNQAVLLTVICLHFEWLLYLSAAGLIYLFMPVHYEWPWEDMLFGDADNLALWLWLGQIVLTLLSMAIIEPLYVAAGFTLYLNRRTQLEGWDIELAFRQIARRLTLLCVGVIVPVLLLGMSSTPLSAHTPDPKEVIGEILAHEDFAQGYWSHTWEAKETFDTETLDAPLWNMGEGFQLFLGSVVQIFEIILWALVAYTLFVLLRLALRYSDFIRRPPPTPTTPIVLPEWGVLQAPQRISGDPSARALTLIQQGELVQAVYLLYFAALQVLRERDGFNPGEGATEGERLRLFKAQYHGALCTYFSELTRAWQYSAYARRPPVAAYLEQLALEWRQHFGTHL